ncbi:MAG: Crp/Fnr family transcriptional regulator [bacterium]
MPDVDASHCLHCPTRQHCLADGLDDDGLQRLSACVRPSPPLRKGDRLFAPEDRGDDCYVVRSGCFKTVRVSADGDETVTGFHLPGDLVGVSRLAGGGRSETAVALETSTACRVLAGELQGLWQVGAGRSLLRLAGRQSELAADHQHTLSQGAADARVAGFLVTLAQRMRRLRRGDNPLPLPMSRTDLARYLGMTLECLSRVLARLSRAGILDATRRQVTVHDGDALRALARRGEDG